MTDQAVGVSNWLNTAIGIGFVLLIFLPLTFESHKIEVELYEPGVYSVKSTWWGLKKNRKLIRWIKPSGYEWEGWCAQDSNGEWYPYLKEEYGFD